MSINADAEVPIYGLYGTKPQNSDPAPVHIENIEDRSTATGWRIKPHRHSKLFQIFCISGSDIDIHINDEVRRLSGDLLVVVPARIVHGFGFQPGSRGWVISVAESAFSQHADRSERDLMTLLNSGPLILQREEDDPHYRQLQQYVDLIRTELSYSQTQQNLSLTLLAQLILRSLQRVIAQNQLQHSPSSDTRLLATRFRTLLENTYTAHYSVADYTRQLAVSPATLRRECLAHFNQTPKAIIQERVLTEAKRQLVYTQQNNQAIADNLGFKDQGYFCRFFKSLTGFTPRQFRARADQG
jgi:AraC family transcriptional activator of pobA